MDADRATYIRAIEEVFFEIRGRGFMLSPRDVALAEEWRTAGVPVRLVARALIAGAQAWAERNPPGATPPGSLAYFRGHIERAAAVHRERSGSGQGGVAAAGQREQRRTDAGKALSGAVAKAGKSQESDAVKDVLRDVWRGLERGIAAGEDLWALAERLDLEMCSAATAIAPADAVTAAEAAALEAVTPARAATMSPRAIANRREAARVSKIRESMGLPDLIRILRDADA